jgi:hypothetical protein
MTEFIKKNTDSSVYPYDYKKQLKILEKEYNHKLITINNEYNIRINRLNAEFKRIKVFIETDGSWIDTYVKVKDEYGWHGNNSMFRKLYNQTKTYIFQLENLNKKYAKRRQNLESDKNYKKLQLKMEKNKNINITLLNGKYYTYNCLYDLIRDLKDNFNDEKEYAILYENLCKNISSIEFLDSIDKIETIDLQLIILHTTI